MSDVKHLVFVNENINLDQSLISKSLERSEIFELSSKLDGIWQIEAIAATYSNLESIQIVSHGNVGQLNLGDMTLTGDNLDQYAPGLSNIGNSLSKDGDIVLYGCNVASSAEGEAFVLGIAKNTGKDVFASTDITGSNQLGANAVLEFKVGNLDTETIEENAFQENLYSWSNPIKTAALKTLADTHMSDNKYNYLEMRTLLEEAAKGGITSDEFTDLKQIYKDVETKFDSDYVKYISHSTINGSGANKYWTGGVKFTSQIENLGNMDVGTSEKNANRLIAKWFKGEDLPMPVSKGDTANATSMAASPDYGTLTGSLFVADLDTNKIASASVTSAGKDSSSMTAGILVTADDMHQGSAGTCYVLACIGSLAHNNSPEMKAYTGDKDKAGKLIQDMFIQDLVPSDHADYGKIYGLQFYDFSGNKHYTTVNTDVPIKNNSGAKTIAYAKNNVDHKEYTTNPKGWVYNYSSGALDGEMWMSLMEKGYAQLAQIILSHKSDVDKYPMSIKTIEGGSAWAFENLVGTSGKTTNYSGNDTYAASYWTKDLDQQSIEDEMIKKMEDGGLGYLSSRNVTAAVKNTNDNKTYIMWSEAQTNTHYKWYYYKDATAQKNGQKTLYKDVTGKWAKYTIPDGGQKLLCSGHAHMVLDYDKATDLWLIRNPHGGDEKASKAVEWWSKLEDLSHDNIFTTFKITNPMATPKTYNYTVKSDAGTKGSAVTEGGKVTFTITRSDKGTDSVVFIRTMGKEQDSSKTAGKNDFSVIEEKQIKFKALETTKTIVIETLQDGTAEGSGGDAGYEKFSLGVFKNVTQSSPTVAAEAWIKDKTPKNYEYEVKTNAGTLNDAIKEGGSVTFTITRNKLGSDEASTVYLTTKSPNAGKTTPVKDYNVLSKHKVSFTAFEFEKKVYVKTVKDAVDDSGEYFTLNLYKSPDDTQVVTKDAHTARGYIKDEAEPVYDYIVTSNAGSQDTAVDEGDTITFTITRSGSGSESSVFISTIGRTAMPNGDYVPIEDKEIIFSKNQKTQKIEVETKVDDVLENTVFFDLGVYKTSSDKVPLSKGTAYINNADVTPDHFYIKSNETIKSSDPIAISANAKVGDNKTLSLQSDATTKLDGGKFVSISSTADESSVVFTITGKDPSGADITEKISGGNKVMVTSTKVFKSISKIESTKATSDKVSVGVFDGVEEGSEITFTVARTNPNQKAGKVFISTTNATANELDFVGLDKFEVKFDSFQNQKTFTIKTNSDSIDDDNEYFSIDLYTQPESQETLSTTYAYINNVAVPTTHTYAIKNNSPTGKGVNEGEEVVFTIERTTSGGKNSESTVYVKTYKSKADGDDFYELETTPVKFSAKDTIKTVAVKTKTDKDKTDDNEDFYLLLFKSSEDAKDNSKSDKYSQAFIKNVDPTDYKYKVTALDSSYANPTEEGDIVTFSIQRQDSSGKEATGSVSNVYISTTPHQAGSKDYVAIDKELIKFESHQTEKIIKLQTTEDTIKEGREGFYFDLFETLDDANAGKFATYTSGYIKDKVAEKTDYDYTITSVHSDKSKSSDWVKEGEAATFTVKRTKLSGDKDIETIVYITTKDGEAKVGTDYQALENGYAIKFNPSETEKEFSVTTNTDTDDDDGEDFFVTLYKSKPDMESDKNIVTHSVAYIKNDSSAADSVANYSYKVETTNKDKASAALEGKDIVFTITRTKDKGSDVESTVFVSTTAGSANKKDYSPINKQKLTFKADEFVKTITVSTKLDKKDEDEEHFYFDLFKTKAKANKGDYDTFATAYIKDDTAANDAVANYSYTISSDQSSADKAVSEGDKLTFTITRKLDKGTASESTVYVSTTDAKAVGGDDFEALNMKAITFKKDQTEQIVTVNSSFDKKTEGLEYFYFDLFKTKASAESGAFDAWSTGYIKDNTDAADALNNYTYSIESLNAAADLSYDANKAVKEGDEAVFIIKRTLVKGEAKKATVYIDTSTSTAKSGDFDELNMTAIKFKKDELEKTVKIKAFIDEQSETKEKFILNLYKTKADAKVGKVDQYGLAYIKDNASIGDAYNYSYTITSSTANSGAAVKEGEDITFTITRAKKDGGKGDAASSIYVSTTKSSADSSDYESLNKFKIDFKATDTEKVVTVNTKVDDKTESTESFYFDLFTTIAKANQGQYETYKTGYIKDDADAKKAIDNYTYTITSVNSPKANGALEGSNATFVIKRTLKDGETASASKVYISTTEATATKYDFVPLDMQLIEFKKDDIEKTIKVETKEDALTDADEYFYLDLFKTKADAEIGKYSVYGTGYIKDNAGAKEAVEIYDYKITSNSDLNAVQEGNDVIFTIERSLKDGVDASKGTSSTVFIKTDSGSADETDYEAKGLEKLVFSNKDDNKKEIKIKAFEDKKAEEKDGQSVEEIFALMLFKSSADAQDGNYYTYGKAKIKDADVKPGTYTYVITSDSKAKASAKKEGEEITVSVTRTHTGGNEGDSTIYFDTTPGKAGKADFEYMSKKELKFTKANPKVDFKIKLTEDSVTDPDEYFYLDLFETKTSTNYFKWDTAWIADKAKNNINYTIESDSAKDSAKSEGSVVTLTIKNPAKTASTIYLAGVNGTASTTDYFVDPTQSVSGVSTVTIENKEFLQIDWDGSTDTITGKIQLVTDKIEEKTDEYFYVELYKSKADAVAGKEDKEAKIYIKDVTNNYTYSIADQKETDAVEEGKEVTLTISRGGTGDSKKTEIFVSTFENTAKETDYTPIIGQKVTFDDTNTATIKLKLTSDSVSEQVERINLGLYESYEAAKNAYNSKTLSDKSEGYLGQGQAFVKDKPTQNKVYKYTLSSSKSKWTEGEDAEITITRDGTGSESTFYISTWDYSTDAVPSYAKTSGTNTNRDLVEVNHEAVVFKSDEKSKTYKIKLNTDKISENDEGFWVVNSATQSANDYVKIDGQYKNGQSGIFLKIKDATGGFYTAPSEKTVGDVYEGSSVSSFSSGGSSGDSTITVTSAPKNTFPGTKAGMVFNDYAFAALTSSNDVITWGNTSMGGDSSSVKDKLKDVSGIYTNAQAFAAVKNDGSVITWGNADSGGDSTSVASDLDGTNDTKDVTKVYSTQNSFAALRKDGSVITWGAKSTGGEGTKNLAPNLDSGVKEIYSNLSAFAALKTDGSVLSWGYSSFGGDSSSVSAKLKNVTDISATGSAFAAIKTDGSVVTWGNSSDGGDSSSIAAAIDGDTAAEDVVQIYATTSAFAALRQNGSVITWGDQDSGGNSSDVTSSIDGTKDVVQIFSTGSAFAALRDDGSVVTWGDKDKGGDSSSVASDLNGTVDVTKVFSTTSAFAALRVDGKVVTWGYNAYGGNSSGVSSLIDGTLDDDVISVDASVKKDANFILVGGKTISFTNAQSVLITSQGDDTALTFTVKGTDRDGNALTGTVKGAKAGSATVLNGGKTAYFKTVESITVDGDTAGNVKAGVTDKTVQTIITTDKAFAALRADGSVVGWGDHSGGGNTSSVNDAIILGDGNSSKVTQLYSSSAAFSAIKDDGSVVAWGDTERGGSTTGVDFGSSKVSGMSGSSSGVDCNVQSWKDASKKISTADLKFYKDGTGSAVSGDFKTDGSGKVSLTGLSGKYSAGYKAGDQSTKDKIASKIDVLDILEIAKAMGGLKSFSSAEKVAANIDTKSTGSETSIDVLDILAIAKIMGGLTKHEDLDDQFVLRDASASDPFANPTFDVGGGSLTLNSYLLGDVDGSFWS